MKLVGILIGIFTGSITGSVIGIFSGNSINDILIAGFLSGLIALIFFKNEIIEVDELSKSETSNLKWDTDNSKIVLTNTWVFWISNFFAAVITCAIEDVSKWGVFISCGLSVVNATLINGLMASLVGLIQNSKK